MSMPLISIITPVFNGEDFIKETVESVLKFSSGYSAEYIIVDDGSVDSTPNLLRTFGDLIKLVSTENQGESAAVNLGMKLAKGEVVLIVSADDPLISSQLFDGVSERFRLNQDLVAIYHDWAVINQNGEILKINRPGPYSDEELIGKFHCLPGPGTFFRLSSAKLIGGRDPKWRFVADYDFWLRLSRIGKFHYRPEVLAQWRSHPNSTSVSLRGKEMAEERIGVIKNFLHTNPIHDDLRRAALGSCYLYAAQLCYFTKLVPGRAYLFQSFLRARKWPKVAKITTVLFILSTPLSRWAVSRVRRIHK
jgi:glycosyltransferase involved in cell wall biosynthesis